jgi:hypothetical protein
MSRIDKDNAGTKVGNVSGCLVDRLECYGNFFEVVDADSQELQGGGCLCFDNMGQVREPMLSQLVSFNSVSSSGGWLYVKEISIIEEERGHMLSHTMLRALFEWTDFSLSCLFPAPWGIEDRRRREVDPLREAKFCLHDYLHR